MVEVVTCRFEVDTVTWQGLLLWIDIVCKISMIHNVMREYYITISLILVDSYNYRSQQISLSLNMKWIYLMCHAEPLVKMYPIWTMFLMTKMKCYYSIPRMHNAIFCWYKASYLSFISLIRRCQEHALTVWPMIL